MKKLIAIILVLISLGSYAQTPPRTGYLVQTAKWKFVNPIWLDSGAYITKIPKYGGQNRYLVYDSITGKIGYRYVSASGNFVPYTGATTDVDLGNFSLNAKSFHAKGTAGTGHLGLKHQSSSATASGSETVIYANSTGFLYSKNDGNPIEKIIGSNDTASMLSPYALSSEVPTYLAGNGILKGGVTFYRDSLKSTGQYGNSWQNGMYLGSYNNRSVIFRVNNTERMRIDTTETLQYTKTISTKTAILNVNGTKYLHNYQGNGQNKSVFLGINAGSFNSTGVDNVGIGENAMYNSSSNNQQNVAIGNNAMALVSSGDDNVGIGHYSLTNVDAGSRNVALGSRSAISNAAYNDAILLGYNTQTSASSTSNETAIGSGVTASGSNTATYGNSSNKAHYFKQFPTASANFGLISIGNGSWSGTGTGFFQGAATGQYIAVNSVGSVAYNFLDFQKNGTTLFEVDSTGKNSFATTITAAGTTGNRTINKPSGTVNIAAAGTTVTVTNSLVSTSSIVVAVIRTNDTTAYIKNVVPSSGSFVINLGAAATAEVSIGFIVYN